MTRNKFHLKTKPAKPLLKNYHGQSHTTKVAGTYEAIDPYKLVTLLEKAQESDPNACFEVRLDYEFCYYESDSPSARLVLKWRGSAQEQLDKAMILYEEKLTKYEVWYDNNKGAIGAELLLREKEAKVAALKKAVRLERKAKAIRKKVG